MTDFLTSKRIKARKPRFCPECNEMIAVGDHYVKHAGVSDGEFFTAVQCVPCDALGERFLASLNLAGYLNWDEKTYPFGSLIETAMDHVEADWEGYRGRPLAELRDLLPALLERGDAAEREHQREQREKRQASKAA